MNVMIKKALDVGLRNMASLCNVALLSTFLCLEDLLKEEKTQKGEEKNT